MRAKYIDITKWYSARLIGKIGRVEEYESDETKYQFYPEGMLGEADTFDGVHRYLVDKTEVQLILEDNIFSAPSLISYAKDGV